MKCLPQAKLGLAQGNVLHDWHAEILALRGLNAWLLDECADLACRGQGEDGTWVRWRRRKSDAADEPLDGSGTSHDHATPSVDYPPFELQDGVRIHMYCSEAPCGDASMELTMAAQPDATAWAGAVPDDAMLGRGHFDRLGVVRRKPARPDAPPTASKSCSDKLALKQCTGLVAALPALLLHPRRVYLDSLVLPRSQLVPEAVRRAFGVTGRMAGVGAMDQEQRTDDGDGDGYAFRAFRVETTTREFAYSRRAAAPLATPCNLATLYTPRRQEVIINGVLQGRKQLDVKGASCVSRRMLWKKTLEVALILGSPALTAALGKGTYADVKQCEMLTTRQRMKDKVKRVALKDWRENSGDDDWTLSSPQ